MLAYNVEASRYKYMPLPWVSKTRYKTWRHCQYDFYLAEIEGATPKAIDDEMEDLGTIGTNMHLVFAEFFNQVKERKLIDDFMRIEIEHRPKDSALFYAFFSLCQDIMPKRARGVREYSRIISNFAEFQVQNWIHITEHVGATKKNYIKYWVPISREKFLRDPQYMYYGTPDAVYRNPNHKHDKKKYIVVDYKTGNTPKAVRDFAGPNPYSIKLPTSKLEELHFYAWLVAEGRYVSIGTVWYLMGWEEDMLTVDGQEIARKRRVVVEKKILPSSETPTTIAGKEWKVNKKNVKYWRKAFEDVNSYNDLLVSMAFLGSDVPYVAIKNTNARTMNNIHKYSQELRDHYDEHGMDESAYERIKNTFMCDKCFQSVTCSEREAREIMGM